MKKEILENSEDFVIKNEEQKELDVIDPLDILVSNDFSDENEDNFEEALEMINLVEKETKLATKRKPETIIGELAEKYLDDDYKTKLDSTIKNFDEFLKKYNVEKDFMKTKNDKEITKIYTIGTFLLNNIASTINQMILNFTISREEFKYIQTILVSKLHYDGNDVFNTIGFVDSYLNKWKEIDKSLPKGVEEFMVTIDITNIVMLYHLINKHSVKGINKEFYTFAKFLTKVGETNKLYDAYMQEKSGLNDKFIIWTTATEEQLKQNGTVTATTLTATKTPAEFDMELDDGEK